MIDVGNGLRQNELALERRWLTKDPWFRIDTTVVGITVIDAYLAAKYQAPPSVGIGKMSVQDWSAHLVSDIWSYNVSMEARSFVPAAANATSEEEGFEVHSIAASAAPGLLGIMGEHQIKTTQQRSGKGHGGQGQLARRKCAMKASLECQGQTTMECHHRSCKRKTRPAQNRHGVTSGVFVCSNHACQVKHWQEMLDAQLE